MEKISFKLIIAIVFALICFGCSRSENKDSQKNAESQNSQKYKLPSGREIKINGINGMNFETGETGLVLNYETDIPIENHEELKKEVEEVWTIFRQDVEREKTTVGIIRASHYEGSGFYRQGKGYGFLFKKRENGKWYLEEDNK